MRNRAICILTLGIFRVSLGSISFAGLFLFRVYHYWLIFILKRRPTGWYLSLPIGSIATLVVAYTVAAIALPPRYGFDYIVETDECTAAYPIYYSGVGIMVVQLIAVVCLVFMARKVTPLFNEFAELVVILVSMASSFGLSIAFRWIIRGNDSRVVIGIINTSLLLVACQVYYIALLGRPVFHALVDPEQYLMFVLRKMKESNLATEYDFSRQQQSRQQQQWTAATLQKATDPSMRSTFTVDSQGVNNDSFLSYDCNPQVQMILVDSWKPGQSTIDADRRIV
ncbi:hypothetical protein FBU59_000635 [Linderina macrospora]|uniref:Uncharacterized protein n=1 Tax=Linderina macrospora TaxID=4868 RepID=A0ACC1JGI3_9FUNG|nr:hypothetical protein FBU59_000635 [Linderina macrospora]